MNYIVRMIGGTRLEITEEDYRKIVGQSSGIVILASNGITINLDRIEAVYPESQADEVEDRRQQTTGVLHDGTMVTRHFGTWVLADAGGIPDDKGNYQRVRIDPSYYPEVAEDKVPSEKEYAKLKASTTDSDEILKAILGHDPKAPQIRTGGFESIGGLLSNHERLFPNGKLGGVDKPY